MRVEIVTARWAGAAEAPTLVSPVERYSSPKGFYDPQTGDAPSVFPAAASRRGGPDSRTASTVAWDQMCSPVGLRFLLSGVPERRAARVLLTLVGNGEPAPAGGWVLAHPGVVARSRDSPQSWTFVPPRTSPQEGRKQRPESRYRSQGAPRTESQACLL